MPDVSVGSSVAATGGDQATRGGGGASRRRVAGALCVLLALVLLASCSDNSDDDATAATVNESNAAACDAFVAIDEASFADDMEGVISAIEDFVGSAPDDVATAVEPLLPVLRSDPEGAEESEELAVAEAASDQWAWENCTDTQIDVVAQNFAFSGMPAEVEAGRVGFRLVNETQTDEFPEAPVLRKAIDQFRGRAKLVYKHFPLMGHDRA